MVERAEELRGDLDDQRERISRTVDQIENRVSPGRVVARNRYRARARLGDWRERIMGSRKDEPWMTTSAYGTEGYAGYGAAYGSSGYGPGYAPGYGEAEEGGQGRGEGARERLGEVGDRARGALSSAGEAAGHAPEAALERAQGNPLAAGLVAFGAGLLAAAVIPETRRERELVRRVEPELQQAAGQAREAGQQVVADLREPAQEAAEHVRDRAQEGAEQVKGQAKGAAQHTTEQARSASGR